MGKFDVVIIYDRTLGAVRIFIWVGKFSKNSLGEENMEIYPNCGSSIKKNAR
ncbi:MAG: hypothetical protein ACFFD2_02050 [Promethearchaeota archaeon]